MIVIYSLFKVLSYVSRFLRALIKRYIEFLSIFLHLLIKSCNFIPWFNLCAVFHLRCKLNHSCILRIKTIWSRCISLLMYY
jgi:hypothetical protein